MNKSELIDAVAENAGLTKAQAAQAVAGFTKSIQEALARGETVSLTGFGSFTVGARAARSGRNPKTGEKMEIKASKSAKFRPGKELKDIVNKG